MPNEWIKPIQNLTHKKEGPKAIGGRTHAIRLGLEIQGKFPEIADDYRKGLSLSAIVAKYHLDEIFSVSPELAIGAVRQAIVGHNGDFDIAQYSGLINEEEARKLGRQHRQAAARRVFEITRKNKKGIFSLTPEEHSLESRRKGNLSLTTKTGVHSLTSEQHSEYGKEGAIARGDRPVTDEEKKEVERLMNDPEYQRGKILNLKKIATEIDRLIHRGKETTTSSRIGHIAKQIKKASNS